MGTHKVMGPYMGIPTFFQAPFIAPSDIEEGMTVVAGVPIDQGVIMAKPGARYGPRKIREASTFPRAVFEAAAERTVIDIDTHVALRLKDAPNVVDIGDFDVDPTNIMTTTQSVIRGVAEIVGRGAFPVVLGGDHYIAYPNFEGFVRGMSTRKPDLRMGYLVIDSHPDFRNDYGGVVGKYSHGSAARRISENDRIAYRNMAWIGLNGGVLDADMFRMLKKHGLKMFSAKALRERGVKEVAREALDTLADDVDAVYMSIDIDVVNNAEVKGTGGPIFGGITATEFLEMMDVLSDYEIIRAVDICEVAPPLDPSGISADLAVAGVLTLLKRRLFDIVEVRV